MRISVVGQEATIGPTRYEERLHAGGRPNVDLEGVS
jgi:hypothetical protein